MNGLREKFRNKKGFTLVEMLIVVAIIAILVAVSIPVVNNALDRAKHTTDAGNERAAKAEIMIQYLSGEDATQKVEADGTTVYCYDAVDGTISTTAPTKAGHKDYGKCAKHGHANKFIVMTLSADGVVTLGWNDSNAMPTGGSLCGETKLS